MIMPLSSLSDNFYNPEPPIALYLPLSIFILKISIFTPLLIYWYPNPTSLTPSTPSYHDPPPLPCPPPSCSYLPPLVSPYQNFPAPPHPSSHSFLIILHSPTLLSSLSVTMFYPLLPISLLHSDLYLFSPLAFTLFSSDMLCSSP